MIDFKELNKKEDIYKGDSDFKYYMQDMGSIYIGGRMSYRNIIEDEYIPFKLKSVVERYILPDIDSDTSLESHLYYLTSDSFAGRTFMQLKVRVKYTSLTERKTHFGKKTELVNIDKTVPIKDFMEMNLAQKKSEGVKISEIVISKLALMTFVV